MQGFSVAKKTPDPPLGGPEVIDFLAARILLAIQPG